MKNYNQIIKEICASLGIKLTMYADSWLKVLEKNNQLHYIVGYKFDLNQQAESLLFDDKYETYELLKYLKIPVIIHHNILKDYNDDEIIKLFHLYQDNIIIKGNNGSCGREVFHVTKEEELFTTIDAILAKQYSLSICPFYQIDYEYRVIVLNQEVKLIYGKINPYVIGDGLHTIQELAEIFNYNYYHKHSLSKEIPKKNEKIILDYRHNLSNGANIFEDINQDIKDKLIDIVNRIVHKTNLKFASIDIINTNNQLMVMEVNTGIMMDNYIKLKDKGYDIAKKIYQEAIELMFKE